MAVIKALEILKEPCHVKVYSDSAYVVNCFQKGWIYGWLRNGWVNSKKEPVENQDLWKQLWGLMKQHQVQYVKVKGIATTSTTIAVMSWLVPLLKVIDDDNRSMETIKARYEGSSKGFRH